MGTLSAGVDAKRNPQNTGKLRLSMAPLRAPTLTVKSVGIITMSLLTPM